MKKAMLSIIILIPLVTILNAQQKQAEYSKSLSDINVIVLNLSGNSTVVFSGSSMMKINSFLYPKGNVWGWHYPAERPEFQISGRQSGDTVFISSPARFIPNIIGISNYSETMNNIVILPDDRKIIVREADNLKIEGHCKWLDVNQAHAVSASIEEYFIRELSCVALKSLKINDAVLSKALILKSSGTDTLYIKAAEINISLSRDI